MEPKIPQSSTWSVREDQQRDSTVVCKWAKGFRSSVVGRLGSGKVPEVIEY